MLMFFLVGYLVVIYTAMASPRWGSFRAEVKVARPSGKLCMPIARAVINPIRFRAIERVSFSVRLPISPSVDGTK